MTIGPRLLNGAHLILFGNDNDYSVTQTGSGEQLDVYVNFNGQFAKCPLDQQTLCQLNDTGTFSEPVPAGHTLIPGVLHAYKAAQSDLAGNRSRSTSSGSTGSDMPTGSVSTGLGAASSATTTRTTIATITTDVTRVSAGIRAPVRPGIAATRWPDRHAIRRARS